ncbi:hypothetical protein F5890DRAFT_1559490 [Lentinula detonsa]|uniref:Uncharacterized protein n=1 Tax=Lentinula detonsa TaxID=2804962 RepID=A0AA38PPH1_9AGAR|nr:hypothetical protein F5890DRAFT_1559490 [Lentinula detonsa]
MTVNLRDPIAGDSAVPESHDLNTRYVAPGKGFHLQLGERHMVFPDVSRAPPELYLTRGYSAHAHVDPCYAPFAFNLNVGRKQYDTPTARQHISIPSYGGANFVDANLRVVVAGAVGTMFAFDPTHVHGTTVTGGTQNLNLTFAFSKKIGEAFAKLDEQQKLAFGESNWGAGEGK